MGLPIVEKGCVKSLSVAKGLNNGQAGSSQKFIVGRTGLDLPSKSLWE